MAIFNNTAFTPVVEEMEDDALIEKYPGIMPTIESAYEIAAESYADMYKLMSALYVSDIVIEQSVMEGANAEVLVENAVKDFANKVVNKLKETWEKIKTWFKQIIDNLKIRFTSSKEFVSKYKSQIMEKAKKVKDFKPSHHNYEPKVAANLKAKYATIVAFAEHSAGAGKKEENFVSNMVKKVAPKATSIGEMKDAVRKELVGETVTDSAIGAAKVTEMIKFCENMSIALAQLEDLKNENKKQIDSMIKKITAETTDIAKINAYTSCYNSALAAMQSLNAIGVQVIGQANKEYVSILRSLMLAKVESVDEEFLMEDSGNESSIFESALNMI